MGSTAARRQRRRLFKVGSLVAALAAALAVAAVSWADSVVPDGDLVTVGDQGSVSLGTVTPGQVITKSVSFKLVCDGKNHVDSGQSFSLTFSLAQSTVPSGGSLSATNSSIGPVPSAWPDDTTGSGSTNCGSPLPSPIPDNGDSTVTITAPPTSGSKTYTVRWNHGALTPVGSGDTNAVQSGNTTVTFTLTVAATDTTDPAINCSVPNQPSWYGSNVTVNCTASDSGSGLANAEDAAFSLSTTVSSGAESAGAPTDSRQVCDNASNCATAGPYTFKIDRKAPSISCGSPDGIWHSANVSIACTSSDDGSGVAPAGDAGFSLSTNVSTGSEDGNASTGTKTVSDAAGNSATAGPISGNEVDKKAPELSSCESPDAVWHAANVTLHCTYTDGGSGPPSPQVSLQTNVSAGDEDGNAAASANGTQACDAVSNCASSPTDIAGNNVDRKPPQLSSCESPDGVWHGANVTLQCTYTDGGSGPSPTQVSLQTSISAGEEDDNASASANGAQACDDAGNCADAPSNIGENMVDRKAPEVSCDAADGAWHADDASIGCTASDGGSGLAHSTDTSFDLTTNVPAGTEDANASTDSRSVADAVGNSATAGPISGNKVDKKAPELSGCESPDGVWHADNVTLHCTYTDGGAGLVSPQVALQTNVSAGAENGNAVASAGADQACDAVSNCAPSPAGIAGNKIDRKAPELSDCESPDGVWHAGNVTLHCTYTDGGSGLVSPQVALQTNVADATETSNASASASGAQACDAVSNCASSPADIAGNRIDRKAPGVSCGSADGNWHPNDVSIGCTAADGGSGLANSADASFHLTTNVPAGTEDANASTNSHAVADAVGNSATAGPVTGNKVDRKAPSISCASPAPVFSLNQAPALVTGTATDGGSGPASQNVSAPADTSSVVGNPKSVTLTTEDNVGNSSSKACGYSVVFNFHGLFQPVDNNGVFNIVNSGQAIPVKFDLSGNQGLNIFAAAFPASTPVSCSGASATDVLEETLTAGNSSLSYDSSAARYIYVWKTEKAWSNTCRRLDLKFIDGAMHSALFKFTK
jgi:hypothetical protein